MFIFLNGVDGRARAAKPADIRLLEDAEEGVVTVTLADGTQFGAAGNVAGILKLMEGEARK